MRERMGGRIGRITDAQDAHTSTQQACGALMQPATHCAVPCRGTPANEPSIRAVEEGDDGGEALGGHNLGRSFIQPG